MLLHFLGLAIIYFPSVFSSLAKLMASPVLAIAQVLEPVGVIFYFGGGSHFL